MAAMATTIMTDDTMVMTMPRMITARTAHAGHSHGPGHVHGGTDKKRVLIAAFLTAGFMVAEAAGGLYTGSLALLADAGHMLTDSVSLGLAWYAFHLADRKATARLTYGFDRVKTLVAYTNGIAIFAIGAWIVVEAFHRVNDPTTVLGGPMLVIAGLGLVVNIVTFFVLHGGDRESLNMRGAILHVLGDLLGSVAALIAAVVIIYTGWMPIDPILSALVAVILFRSAWSLVRESGNLLLEGVPESMDRDSIARDIEAQRCRRQRSASHACLVARRDEEHGDAARLPQRRRRRLRRRHRDQVTACQQARHRACNGRARIRRVYRRFVGACSLGKAAAPHNGNATGNIMAGRLKGKIAVVTAAGQGIGRAIAEAFVAEGATVYASDVSRDKLEGLARAKKAKLDVLSTKAVEAYAAKVGPVDILVNVAGFVHHGTVLDHQREGLGLLVRPQREVDASHHQGVSARHAGARRSGKTSSIVNISSGASLHPGHPEPLCLRRQQGGRHRPDEIGRRRLHPRRHPLQCDLRPAPSSRPPGKTASRRSARSGAARKRRSTCSCSASRWAASPKPPKSPPSSSTSPPTKPASPPAR